MSRDGAPQDSLPPRGHVIIHGKDFTVCRSASSPPLTVADLSNAAQYEELIETVCCASEAYARHIGPYLPRLKETLDFSFHFVDANIVTDPDVSIAAFYDEPCYRFFHWAPSKVPFSMEQVRTAYDYLHKVIKEHGPFDGVMGFSQGCVMSAALLQHHAKTHPEDPVDALFRFAILFSSPGWPPEDADGSIIPWGDLRVPSLHIIGQADEEWYEGGIIMYHEHCEEGTARLIEHEDGHSIPKDPPTVNKIIEAIEELVQRASA